MVAIIEHLAEFAHPAYLRLGRCELPRDFVLPAYAPWRCLLRGEGPTMVVVGPLAGSILDALRRLPEQQRPTFWVATELPFSPSHIPAEFLRDLQTSKHLWVVEEHVAQGSAGQMLAHILLEMGEPPQRFTHRHARAYPSGYYGSQRFHRKECGLDPESIVAELER